MRALLLPFLLLSSLSIGQTQAKGAERAAILNAIRVPVQRDLRVPVTFVVHQIRVLNGWAYVDAEPKAKSGKPIDYKKTKFREAYEAGAFDSGMMALLQKVGGRWQVKEYAVGPTDVAYIAWQEKYHLPDKLFRSGS